MYLAIVAADEISDLIVALLPTVGEKTYHLPIKSTV